MKLVECMCFIIRTFGMQACKTHVLMYAHYWQMGGYQGAHILVLGLGMYVM